MEDLEEIDRGVSVKYLEEGEVERERGCREVLR